MNDSGRREKKIQNFLFNLIENCFSSYPIIHKSDFDKSLALDSGLFLVFFLPWRNLIVINFECLRLVNFFLAFYAFALSES